jgi:excisionase family DNA binding protein
MLKAAEAGKLLGLSARTMYALAAAGKIACHRMGLEDSAVRFEEADVLAYKESCRSPATTPAAGCSSLTASSPEPGSALTDYFRKAGREPKRKPTTSGKRRDSTSLRLVESNPSA